MSQDEFTHRSKSCARHPDHVIDSYCYAHEAICCSVCRSKDHQWCHVMKLQEAAATAKSNNHYQGLQKSMSKLNDKLKYLHEKKENELISIEKEMFDATAEIYDEKKQLENLLDKAVDRTIYAVEAKYTSCKQKICEDMQRLEQLKATLDDRLREIKSIKDNTEAFVYLKMGQEEEGKGKRLLSAIEKVPQQKIGFKKTINLRNVLLSTSTIGTVVKDQGSKVQEQTYVAVFHKQSCIGSVHNESRHSNVTGSCQLADATILLADWCNKGLKRLDFEYKLIDSLALSGSPSDVCCIDAHQAAVSIQWKKQVHFVSTGIPMATTRHFTVNEPCRGIAFHNNYLFVACGGGGGRGKYHEGPGQVQILNTLGNVLKTFRYDCLWEQLFDSPSGIAVNPITNHVHVCDNANGLITLDMDGNQVWRFSDPDLGLARGVCLDELGQVFVCDFISGDVFLLSTDGRKLCKLVGNGFGKERTQCLVYDEVNSRLLIGMENDQVDIYRLMK